MLMIAGELAFYDRLALLFDYHDNSEQFAIDLVTNGTQYGMHGLSEDEIIQWVRIAPPKTCVLLVHI